MKPSSFILLAAGTFAITTAKLVACIWDTDTMAAERSRMPDVADLIAGNFPRHSREFHAWRRLQGEKLIERRAAHVGTYDDLAVSLHKMGDHKLAIETMRTKELLFPGLYETRSNLGTFYIYTGQLNEALKSIEEALVINPNAHFDREKYQHWLVEWIQERQKAGAGKPLENERFERAMGKPFGFALFVARKESARAGHVDKPEITLRQLDDAIFGVSGMMRFADFDNPLLLEALGDLLLAGDVRTNVAQLACLSYLHASRKAVDEKERERLLALAQSAGAVTPDFKLGRYEKLLDADLAKGSALAEKIRQDEIAWIAAGKDASAEFKKKYLPKK